MERDATALRMILASLIKDWENETTEFKAVGDAYPTDKIGQYFSALSNEANLRGASSGWLVFGVDNDTRIVTGTGYRPQRERLESLKNQVTDGTEPQATFRAIHELSHPGGRVLMFEVPPAPRGIPIAWKGHYYARAGESLAPLSLDKLDQIRNQGAGHDWSAVTVPGATFDELDPAAVRAAREAFALKRQNTVPLEEVLAWPIETFAERIKILEHGYLTRAGLLLLGGAESAGRLTPNMAQITWKLVGPEVAYEHFGPPFFLATDHLYSRIRNIQVRLLSPTRLIPEEISKYDKRVVLEAIHNMIAHQEFAPGSRAVVTEFPDRLEFLNVGSFFDGSPDEYALGLKTPTAYRNPRLVQVMAELNMMDTIGHGIHMMNTRQVGRFLPLPTYDLSEANRVKLTVYGSVVDQAYTDLLMRRTDLPLEQVLALDRVQKGLAISDLVTRRLRRAGLVEGRRPNLRVAAVIADATGQRADYIRRRGQDDEYYVKLVLDYLDEFGTATRADVNALLLGRFGETMSEEQRLRKVGALLTRMRLDGLIRNAGTRTRPSWERVK